MSTTAASNCIEQIDREIDLHKDDVIGLSQWIHAHPELAFHEVEASSRLSNYLEDSGFTVERCTGNLETAFKATAGQGPLTIALCVEYDALPAVGHACGHNLIAGASVAAAVGLHSSVDDLGITLHVIGTPAEETGGGKQLLLDAGVFDDVDAAMMIHTMPEGMSYSPRDLSMQVVGRFRATYTGIASHAAAAPDAGRNAGSAAALAQMAVGVARQHIPDGQRVGLIVESGGDAINIIPESATLKYECRANDLDSFEILRKKIENCVRSGAVATECELSIEQDGPVYRELTQDEQLTGLWERAIARLGYDVSPTPGFAGGSTDMGNVSAMIPSIHPFIGLPGVTAPIHSREFAQAANTDVAYRTMIDSAKALAATVVLLADPEQRARFSKSTTGDRQLG
jgi:amidohydrolase